MRRRDIRRRASEIKTLNNKTYIVSTVLFAMAAALAFLAFSPSVSVPYIVPAETPSGSNSANPTIALTMPTPHETTTGFVAAFPSHAPPPASHPRPRLTASPTASPTADPTNPVPAVASTVKVIIGENNPTPSHTAHPERTGTHKTPSAQPGILRFTVSPEKIRVGELATLCASLTQGTTGTVKYEGTVPDGGSACYSVSPSQTTTYQLRAFAGSHDTIRDVTLYIREPSTLAVPTDSGGMNIVIPEQADQDTYATPPTPEETLAP